MRWYGRPKVTSVQLGKLSLRREHWGCVNTVADSGRKGRFYVARRGSPVKDVVKEGLGARRRAVVEGEGVKQLVKQTVCGAVRKLD
jgi:hypothetical protein